MIQPTCSITGSPGVSRRMAHHFPECAAIQQGRRAAPSPRRRRAAVCLRAPSRGCAGANRLVMPEVRGRGLPTRIPQPDGPDAGRLLSVAATVGLPDARCDRRFRLRMFATARPIPLHPVGNELALLRVPRFSPLPHRRATGGGDTVKARSLRRIPTQRFGDANTAQCFNDEIRASRLGVRTVDPNMDDIERHHIRQSVACFHAATGRCCASVRLYLIRTSEVRGFGCHNAHPALRRPAARPGARRPRRPSPRPPACGWGCAPRGRRRGHDRRGAGRRRAHLFPECAVSTRVGERPLHR
jgi:hypothetical protein